MSESKRETGQILVALDGSSLARSAGNMAVQIASGQDFSIRGLNVVSDRLIMSQYSNYREELKRNKQLTSRPERVEQFARQGTRALRWLRDRCRERNVPLSTDILFGGVSELLLNEGGQIKLIALGRRGYSHANDPKHIGHNFRFVAHRAAVPILAGGGKPETLKRVLLAYDGSAQARKALAWVARLQKTLFAKVIALTVQPIGKTTQRRVSKVRRQLDASGLSDYEFINRRGRLTSQVASVAAESRANLIVMGSYSHSAVLEWLMGSRVENVLRRTQRPVLLV